MKKVIFVLILLCVMACAHADENTFTSNNTTQINKKVEFEYRKNFLYMRVSPLLIPGVAVGYTHRIRLIDETTIDFTLAGHYHFYREFQKSAGLSFITEHFGNPNGNGFFYRMNLGAEYGEYADPFDDDPEPDKLWMPNITFGLGYGFNLGNFPSLRISAELGWTAIIGRVNIEFLY